MKYIYQLLTVLFLVSSQTIIGQVTNYKETPEWVKPIEIPTESTFSKYDIKSGYYFTLADYQIHVEDEALFNHEVINVVSYSGVTEASQLSVSYDTTYQELIIHHLYIWRKGEKIDRTHDLSFEVMNNQQNLQQGIYTGLITAYDILNDIRKDDLIDFSYTLKGENPIFDQEKYFFIPMEMMNPIDLYSLRVICPASKDYLYKCADCDSLSITDLVSNDYRIIEILNKDVKPIELEEFMPNWSLPFKYFNLSSMHSWKEVNSWAQRVFALNEACDLESAFEEIFTGNETTEDKINKIINFVQDDIRYMGIESGIGSIKPFSPEQVVKQRFGDCKDKSLLLVTLLKEIGIEKSYPVLVNTYLQHEVDAYYPNNEIFNHAIVRFDYHDTTYWVDPSIAQQGGDFRDLFNLDYGKVLIVGLPADTLQNMSPRMTNLSADITEELTVHDFNEPSKLVITSVRTGFEADQRRAILQYFSPKDMADGVAKDLKLLFPEVARTGELEISDDIDSNQFKMVYTYEVGGFWENRDEKMPDSPKGFRFFRFEPILMYQYLKLAACEDRKFDYMLKYPTNLHYRVIMHFPEDMLFEDNMEVFENKAFYCEKKIEQIDTSSLQIDYVVRTKINAIKADDYKGICEQMSDITKDMPIVIYFFK